MQRIKKANMFVQMKIENILDYDMINIKRFTPQMESFDAKEAVSEVISIIQVLNSEETEFLLRLYGDLNNIRSDKARIKQVLLNLLQ